MHSSNQHADARQRPDPANPADVRRAAQSTRQMPEFGGISVNDRSREFDIRQLENAVFQPRLKQVHVEQQTMSPRFAFISIPLLVISGCAGLASTETMSSSSPGQTVVSDMATLHRIESSFQVVDPSALQIQLKDLQAGQQVRLVTSASTLAEMKDGGSLDTTEYVGTIGAIDADNIVLKDASLVARAKVVRATPIVSRVPYFSRMFKNTTIGQETHTLPHGVTVPRSKVIVAIGTGAEVVKRMGVDFDFNADTNGTAERTHVTFLIREHSNQQQPE